MLKDGVENKEKKTFEKRIFKASREYFKSMLVINENASKDIVKAVDNADFEEAERIFKEVLRGWWQSYENDYRREGESGVDKSPYQEVFTNLNVNSKHKKPYPARPRISGFLTEIFVIHVIQQLLGKEYAYLHGQPVEFLKVDGKKRAPQPDISIKLGKEYKIIIEVKTNIPSHTDVKRIRKDHERCKGNGVPYYLICAGAEDIDGVSKVVVENLCECDIEEPYWVYMPHDKNGDYEGVKRFKSIVEEIRKICG